MLLNIVVIVPRLSGAMPELNVANAAFQEPARDQCLPPMHARAIHLSDMSRLSCDVERIRRFHLHAIGQFEGLNPRFKPTILAPPSLVFLIELMQQIELLALFFG